MHAYVINIMLVLIIFPVILQTDISVIMLSIGGQGCRSVADTGTCLLQVSMKVCRRWWDDYIVTEQGLAEAVHQAGSWRQMSQVQNASELPPSSVYGLTVRDPRLFLPQRRTLPSYSARGELTYWLIYILFYCLHYSGNLQGGPKMAPFLYAL